MRHLSTPPVETQNAGGGVPGLTGTANPPQSQAHPLDAGQTGRARFT